MQDFKIDSDNCYVPTRCGPRVRLDPEKKRLAIEMIAKGLMTKEIVAATGLKSQQINSIRHDCRSAILEAQGRNIDGTPKKDPEQEKRFLEILESASAGARARKEAEAEKEPEPEQAVPVFEECTVRDWRGDVRLITAAYNALTAIVEADIPQNKTSKKVYDDMLSILHKMRSTILTDNIRWDDVC